VPAVRTLEQRLRAGKCLLRAPASQLLLDPGPPGLETRMGPSRTQCFFRGVADPAQLRQ